MQDNIIVFPEPPPGDKAQLVTHMLPVQFTQLVGREQEVKAIHALFLRPDVRLLTLTGTAGVGKTRLALEVARELVHDFTDGVHLVSLAPISDPAFVIPAIAHRLGLTGSGSQPLLDLLKTSQHDKHRLLLLDNFEHVISAATLLAELLEACPDVKILVTSREVLRLRAEYQFTVPPLTLPDLKRLPDDQSLAHVPSMNLFIQRAQTIKPDFQLTTDNAATIAEICIRLDGLPLAIELAAARVKVLAPQALLARLDRRLHVLTGGARDLPERQQTLRNTLAWSYELLTAQEQRLFRRLSVFVGGCTLEAIEAVSAALDDEADHVLEGVASLLDKSLLQQTEQEGIEQRLMMLETIREYGREALTTHGEVEATHQAHAGYYLALAEVAELAWESPQESVWLVRLELEHDNLRAAMSWLLECGEAEMALRLGAALWRFWNESGSYHEGWNFLESALEGSEEVAIPIRAKALWAAGDLVLWLGHFERGEALCQESLTLFRATGDAKGMGTAVFQLGMVAESKGDFAAAQSHYEESLIFSRGVGNTNLVAWTLRGQAEVAILQGEYARAGPLLEECLALFSELGNNSGTCYSLLWSALALFSQGDLTRAHVVTEECLLLYREKGTKHSEAEVRPLLGEITFYQGDTSTARLLFEKSCAFYREVGDEVQLAGTLSLLARVNAAQGDLAAARAFYEESLTRGKGVNSKLSFLDIPPALEGLAAVAAVQGEPMWAARLWGTADAQREAYGTPLAPIYRADYEQAVAEARTQLGEQSFATAWAEGRTLTPEQAIINRETHSLSQPASTFPPSRAVMPPLLSPAGLTPREMDVLRLLAQGLTSAQIAKQLVIGVVTVNFHVRSIYSKLGVTSRAAATRYALEHHLV